MILYQLLFYKASALKLLDEQTLGLKFLENFISFIVYKYCESALEFFAYYNKLKTVCTFQL